MTEWKEYKLGEVITVKYGKDHKALKDGLYPVYGSGGIMRYADNFLYDKESILIPRKGSLNNIFYREKAFWTVDTMFYSEIDTTKVFPKFLFYQLKLVDFENLNVGSAVPSLTIPIINDIDISLPPLPEQIRIASILSSLDDKIDLLHRENKTLEAMAETLFRQWFIEEAKEDWEEGKLGDEFEFTMGQSPNGDSFNEDGIGFPMYQGNADFGFRFPTRRVFTTQPTRFAEINDTLISVRAPVGAQNMATEKCCIGRGVAAFRYKHNHDFYSYTYYKLKSLLEEIKQYNDNGTVFGSISKSDFENIDIVIPDINTIQHFQEQVKPIDDKIINNNKQIKTLIQQRDSLLPKLMSGEVKVGE